MTHRFLLSLFLFVSAVFLAGYLWERSAKITLPLTPSANLPPLDLANHDLWQELLHRHVDSDGRVAYSNWQASPADCQKLDDYLHQAATVNPARLADKNAALAYWINLYNALTIKGILLEFPTSSILHHVKPVGYNIWDDLLLPTPAGNLSLTHIEHAILRKMNEPRIHFAIVCASVGCPRLLNAAYCPATLDADLTENARHFFRRSQSFQVTPDQQTIYVSPILAWFATDFGPDAPAQLRAIAPYLPTESEQSLARAGKPSLRYLSYNWSLNGH